MKLSIFCRCTRMCMITMVMLVLCCLHPSSHAYVATPWHQLEGKRYSFEDYVAEHGKVYASEEEYHQRKAIFQEKLEKILAFNRRDELWKMGVNHFTDRTSSEMSERNGYKEALTHYVRERGSSHMQYHQTQAKSVSELPTHVDWRQKNAVSAVKDQMQCGSCWAFATSEVLESHYYLATGKHMLVSPQQIASCTQIPMDCQSVGLGGCQGGSPVLAYQNIIRGNFTTTEFQYPYLSSQGENFACLIPQQSTSLKLAGYTVVGPNNYLAVMDAVANVGPVTIIVDASYWSDYESGIFKSCSPQPQLDHAVLLVGYGVDEENVPYWIIRNSWSVTWGENGYIRVARNEQTECIDNHDIHDCDSKLRVSTICGDCGLLFDVTYPRILRA